MNSALRFLINHFPDLLDLNLTASIVILFVICVRQFLKGAPKIFSYALWGIVLLRLLVPVSIESPVSVVPERTELSSMVEVNGILPEIEFETPQDRMDNELQKVNTAAGKPLVQTSRSLDAQSYLTFAWLLGIGVMVIRSIISFARLKRKVKVVIPFRKGIYIADDIDTPFVMGFFNPKIYLPGTLNAAERKYIIAHEGHHIRRGDHIFKALGFLALIIHWFNPFVWAAFILSGRDMEMSCDEAVIRKLGENVRAEYSASLLNLATGRRMFSATPLAFDEGDPTERVRNLARWKKPAFWVILLCVIVCIVLAVCLLTDPERSFPMEFEQYFTYGEKAELLSGSNREMEQTLSITFDRTSGPRELELELWYQKTGESWIKGDSGTITLQETCEFTIPGGSIFAVAATANGGQGGYATVSLSAGQGIVFDKFEHDLLTSLNTKSSREEASAWTVPEANEDAFDAGTWGVTVTARDQTETSAELVFILDNAHPQGTLTFGENFRIYLQDNNQWTERTAADAELPIEPAAVEHLTGITPGQPVYQTIDWYEEYGNLPAGKYRIQMTVYLQRDGEFPESRPVYAEFDLAGDLSWAVSTQVHDVTPEGLVLTYHNKKDDSIWRLPGYTLQSWHDGYWVDMDVGKTWHESTEQVDFDHLGDPQNGLFIRWDGVGSLPEGQYRIGQEFCTDADLSKGLRFTVYALFEVKQESGGITTLEKLPEVYSGEQAMLDGCLVSRDGEATDNIEAFRDFVDRCNRGTAGFFRIVNWYYGDDPHYIAKDLTFDGAKYIISWLEDGQRQTREYAYLRHFTGEKEQENIAYDAYEHYVLVNDPNVTWQELWEGTISSRFGAYIDHMTIFTDYIYNTKHPELPSNPAEAMLECKGLPVVTVTDFDRLEKLWILFEDAEFLGYEPKTHSIGVGLNLILTAGDGQRVTIELDPDNDLARIDGEYISYGKPDEPCYILKLWEYLGIGAWPEFLYESCPNAFRP